MIGYRHLPGSTGFNAYNYGSPLIWWDPDDNAKVATSGGNISGVTDKGTAGYNLSARNLTVQRGTAGTRSTFRYGTANSSLGVTVGAITSLHWFVVAQADLNTRPYQCMMNVGTYTPDLYFTQARLSLQYQSSVITTTDLTMASATWFLAEWYFDVVAKTLSVWLNGVASSGNPYALGGGTPNSFSGNLSLGADGNSGNGDGLVGDQGDSIGYTSQVTGSNLTGLRAGLKTKWSLTGY